MHKRTKTTSLEPFLQKQEKIVGDTFYGLIILFHFVIYAIILLCAQPKRWIDTRFQNSYCDSQVLFKVAALGGLGFYYLLCGIVLAVLFQLHLRKAVKDELKFIRETRCLVIVWVIILPIWTALSLLKKSWSPTMASLIISLGFAFSFWLTTGWNMITTFTTQKNKKNLSYNSRRK